MQNNMKEIWKEIVGYENIYQISNKGRVKSLGRWVYKEYRGKRWKEEKILKPSVNKRGYLYVGLCKNRKVKYFHVHRLVAEAFIKNHNNLPQVNHKDENKQNNCVQNLEFCDAKYNINYGTRNERIAEKLKGMKHTEETKNKISEANSKPVLQIDKITNEVIAEFPSIIEVQRQLGINQSTISKCCLGKQNTAGNYKWQFNLPLS